MSGTDYTLTPNYGLYKPISNADINGWGGHLNSNADMLDTAVLSVSADRINVRDHGAKGDGVTDDSAAVAAAITAGAGRVVFFPAGTYLINTANFQLSDISLEGVNVDRYGQHPGSPTNVGSELWITDTTHPVFNVGALVRIRGLSFFWPNQTEATCAANGGVPIAYPPLFLGQSSGVGRCIFANLRVVNCYDYFVALNGAGDINMNDCRVFAIRDYFRMTSAAEVIFVNHCLFSLESYDYGLYGSGTGAHTLLLWHSNNSTFMHAVGPGNGTTSCGVSAADCYLYGMKIAVWADTGMVWALFDNTGIDGVQMGWRSDPTGGIVTSIMQGGNVFQYNSYQQIVGTRTDLKYNLVSVPATQIDMPFILSDNCPYGCGLTLQNVMMTQFDGVPFYIAGASSLVLTNCQLVGGRSGGKVLGYATKLAAFGNTLIVRGCTFQAAGHDYIGIQLGPDSNVDILQDNYFEYPGIGVDLSLNTGTAWLVMSGNVVVTAATAGLNNPLSRGYIGSNSLDNFSINTIGGQIKFVNGVGFNGTTPIVKPTVAGAWAGNTAGKALSAALAAYGLITDSTTA